MKKICAWCDRVLDPGTPGTTDISHGICPDCLVVWRAEALAAIAAQTTKGENMMSNFSIGLTGDF